MAILLRGGPTRRQDEPEIHAAHSGRSVETVACVFLILTWVTVLVRFWVRARIVRCIGWDDITMGITMVGNTAYFKILDYGSQLILDILYSFRIGFLRRWEARHGPLPKLYDTATDG